MNIQKILMKQEGGFKPNKFVPAAFLQVRNGTFAKTCTLPKDPKIAKICVEATFKKEQAEKVEPLYRDELLAYRRSNSGSQFIRTDYFTENREKLKANPALSKLAYRRAIDEYKAQESILEPAAGVTLGAAIGSGFSISIALVLKTTGRLATNKQLAVPMALGAIGGFVTGYSLKEIRNRYWQTENGIREWSQQSIDEIPNKIDQFVARKSNTLNLDKEIDDSINESFDY